MKSKSRPKLLVIGSGFHKHILGKQVSPLACWCTLLKQVGLTKKLDVSRLDLSQPTLAWESMVTALVEKDKKREIAASKAENELRKTAVEILAKDADKYQDLYLKHPLVERIAQFKGHIVNLNFDNLLNKILGIRDKEKGWPSTPPTPHIGRKSDSDNLYRRWFANRGDGNKAMIWHPHGAILKKDSLRLGLRDYGFQPTLFAGAFECFKAWEKEVLGSTIATKQPRSEKEYLTLLDRSKLLDFQDTSSKHKPIEKHDNWFTRFMLYDVIIIGAGIGPDEFSLRWLLVQRQRNFARVKDAQKRPKTIYCDVNKSIPLGLVELDVFGSWEDAWEKALS